MADAYDLRRFLDAQDPVYETVLTELEAGRKRTHWMWFIFPQMRGLGHSATATHFGIRSRDEAVAYLEHGVLGARLRRCARLLTSLEETSADLVLGPVDAVKLRSSMTLFAAVADDDRDFVAVLAQYYGGEPDPRTLDLLASD
ncbi:MULTISPECIES: DUF1810 domain-containing protein [unclassified Mycolicibacterium]|jgi:uncharacterized protein (DUF1810 family)|uniref:DUF1810 domain-containing protein n=1 Tax=unclassified Mycolicibacterium TaxID=2636767 RepID=UPI001F4BD0CC|nr:DUF1810 domain-containing protein [Mycolicibacterium sp. YH-1]UNB55616.1 DUF1810 domain-containing protein [Mycolicibacterium sp. YH-1]